MDIIGYVRPDCFPVISSEIERRYDGIRVIGRPCFSKTQVCIDSEKYINVATLNEIRKWISVLRNFEDLLALGEV